MFKKSHNIKSFFFLSKEHNKPYITAYFKRIKITQKFRLLLQSEVSHVIHRNIKQPTEFSQIAHWATWATWICNLTSVLPILFCKCMLMLQYHCWYRLVQQGLLLSTEISDKLVFFESLIWLQAAGLLTWFIVALSQTIKTGGYTVKYTGHMNWYCHFTYLETEDWHRKRICHKMSRSDLVQSVAFRKNGI